MDHRLRNVDRVERNAVSDATSAATAAQPIPGRWKALAVLAAGLSLIILDGTIVGIALPTMISALNLNLTDAQWVNAIYNIQRHLRCSPARSRPPRRPDRASHHLCSWRGPVRRRIPAGRNGVGTWLPHRLAYRPGCGRRARVAVHPVIGELTLPGQGSRRRFRHLGCHHEWHGSPRPTAGRSLD